MSQAQLATFLAAAKEAAPGYAPLFVVLAHTALRPGEAFALRWPDLDFTNRSIRVERAWSKGRVETPKTGRSRMVDMSEHTVRTLRRLRVERQKASSMAGVTRHRGSSAPKPERLSTRAACVRTSPPHWRRPS
jgi:integrase